MDQKQEDREKRRRKTRRKYTLVEFYNKYIFATMEEITRKYSEGCIYDMIFHGQEDGAG